MHLLIFAALVGCATIHEPVGEKPPVVTYWGTVRGAEILIEAQDERAYDLAENALDKGLPVSLTKSKDFVGFTAGNSYNVYPTAGGYASADVVSTGNGWYLPTGQGGLLPTLATTVVDSVGSPNNLAECPEGRSSRTPEEQAACARVDVRVALKAISAQKK